MIPLESHNVFFVLGIHWTSWICRFVVFIKFRSFSVIFFFNYLFCSLRVLFPLFQRSQLHIIRWSCPTADSLIFYLSVSTYIVFIAVSASLLMLAYVVFNLVILSSIFKSQTLLFLSLDLFGSFKYFAFQYLIWINLFLGHVEYSYYFCSVSIIKYKI